MNTDSFHFKVGMFECIAVSDGTLTYSDPVRTLFANAPKEQLAQVLPAYSIQLEQWSEWVSPFICLVIRTAEHCVLLDTGVGTIDFAPKAGKLVQNLQAVGIQPADIDTVILTHGHPDHIGGITDVAGKVVFANARHVMWQAEWEFWSLEAGLAFDEFDAKHARRKLSPLAGRLDLINREIEIVPGIHAVLAAGHTPGHMALAVVSASEELLYVGDAFGHPIHLEHPDWNILYDYQPELAVQSRRQLRDRAVAGQARILAFHFDFPGLGYVRHPQGEWKWQPM